MRLPSFRFTTSELSPLTSSLDPVPVNVNDLKVDVVSISGHKIYGPKGVGCLYVRRKPRVRLEPIINGGGQERGLRSGTVPVPLVVGLGEACRLAKKEMAVRSPVFLCLGSAAVSGGESAMRRIVRLFLRYQAKRTLDTPRRPRRASHLFIFDHLCVRLATCYLGEGGQLAMRRDLCRGSELVGLGDFARFRFASKSC